MKIIHCSDLHLDADLTGRFDGVFAAQRRAELIHTLIRLCRRAQEMKACAVLICGDLFDTQSPSSSSVRAVEDLICSCSDVLFFYLRGNHDASSPLFAGRKMPGNCFLFGQDWTGWELEDGAGGGRKVCITGKEPSKGPFSPPPLDPANINIVMLHGQVREGYSAPDPESVPLGALRGRGIDYLALGHLHHYRSFALDGRGTAAYSGCLEGRGFDECGECGFVLLDTDAVPGTVESRFVPFAARSLYRVECDVTGCRNDAALYGRIADSLNASPAGDRDLVRLELTGGLEYGCRPDPASIRAEWGDRYHYFDYICSASPVVHSEEFVCDATLKGEFVRTVSAEEKLSGSEKAGIIRCGLRALSGAPLF